MWSFIPGLVYRTNIDYVALESRRNEHDAVSNHRSLESLLNRLFRRESKKISKLRVTGLCEGNSPVAVEFPAQRASNAENVSIWWRHHRSRFFCPCSRIKYYPLNMYFIAFFFWCVIGSNCIKLMCSHIFPSFILCANAIVWFPLCQWSFPARYGYYIISGFEIVGFAGVWSCVHDHTCWSWQEKYNNKLF